MTDRIVDIHVPARKDGVPEFSYVDEGLGKYGRPEMALAIAEHGLRPTFSRGLEAYDLSRQTARILEPKITNIDGIFTVTVEPQCVALEGIHAIRNITKIIDHNKDLPELNHPDVRALARDKVAANKLAQSLGMKKIFAAWEGLSTIFLDQILEEIPGDDVVMKPRRGGKSEGVVIASKADIMDRQARDEFGHQEWVVEQKLDFGPSIDVAGIDDLNQAKIDRANELCAPKELRAYAFGRDEQGNLQTNYVLRVPVGESETYLPGGERDEWVYLNGDSIPSEVAGKTDQVVRAIEEQTGVREVHVAVDWVRVLHAGSDNPEWLPMEINGSEPQLIRSAENAEVSALQTNLMAAQLYRVAQRRSTT